MFRVVDARLEAGSSKDLKALKLGQQDLRTTSILNSQNHSTRKTVKRSINVMANKHEEAKVVLSWAMERDGDMVLLKTSCRVL